MNIDPLAAAATAVAAPVGVIQRQANPGPDSSAQTPAVKIPDTSQQQSQQDVEGAVRSLDQAINPLGLAMQFSRDDATGSMVLKMINQSTGEILQQIPNEVSVRLAEVFGKLQGQVVDRLI